jgi:membrane protein implicated in regulation of membrane protease activity
MEVWIVFITIGVLFIISELVIPGGITIFVGLAAITTGLLIKYQFLVSVPGTAFFFLLISIFYLLILRTFFLRYFQGKFHIENVDEDLDAVGRIVEVVEEVGPSLKGRVYFNGVGWEAESDEFHSKGTEVKIVSRRGNVLFVRSK